MTLELTWELISTVGFPIFAYLLLYFDLRTQLIKRIEDISEKLDQHLLSHSKN